MLHAGARRRRIAQRQLVNSRRRKSDPTEIYTVFRASISAVFVRLMILYDSVATPGRQPFALYFAILETLREYFDHWPLNASKLAEFALSMTAVPTRCELDNRIAEC